ncbi:uncharacterized protein YjbJ (UPF0337 family) [Geodermatophilus bullaregiensis]|uniref:hypothetical protein n=1 Tax=Geodermatophilus bullaregiensis TaxID=1564160 RepID=UPI00195D1C56|nr:hypothetical protein [Geodermatophilus bullaregiensis]MBM7806464.1 uncharacterized protein YjbJ (UPF0337 family) [Geodermatophilus bullaregiensis]
MSFIDRARAKAEELLGRAEEVYGQSHGDAAATVAGEAHRLEAEVELEEGRAEEADGRGTPRRTDDDGSTVG